MSETIVSFHLNSLWIQYSPRVFSPLLLQEAKSNLSKMGIVIYPVFTLNQNDYAKWSSFQFNCYFSKYDKPKTHVLLSLFY